MTRPRRDYLLPAVDDGYPAPEVGSWAVEKYRRLGMYAEIFSTGMKNRWDSRVYLDLFAGSGHAIIKEPRMRVMTSPLLAAVVKDPFDKYVFCDTKKEHIDHLRRRVDRESPTISATYIVGSANDRCDEIEAAIPSYSQLNKVLSFCFVDPFGLDIHFETIRRLGEGRAMDFLTLLALGMDATRNWARYCQHDNTKVDLFLGNSAWRERWNEAHQRGPISPIRFLAEEYASGMTTLGYLTPGLDRMIEVRTHDNNMRLYYLAFFSKSERGYQFWDEVRKYSTDQLGLGI